MKKHIIFRKMMCGTTQFTYLKYNTMFIVNYPLYSELCNAIPVSILYFLVLFKFLYYVANTFLFDYLSFSVTMVKY